MFSKKGLSIKEVYPEGEGGGYPKKETWEDGGRDPVLGKGDVFFNPNKWCIKQQCFNENLIKSSDHQKS